MTMRWFPPSRVKPLRGGPTPSWGILAPGQIADDFAATVLANTDQTIHAVASRSAQRSRRFADRHQIDLWGYERRFGIIHVDYPTQRRTIKDSARFYADVIRANASRQPSPSTQKGH
jgi:hypothetical protein